MISRPGSSRLLLPALGLSGSSPSRKGYRGVRVGAGVRPTDPHRRRSEGRTLSPQPGAAQAGRGLGPRDPPRGHTGVQCLGPGFPVAPHTMGSKQSEAGKMGGARRQEDCRARGSRTRVTEALGWGVCIPTSRPVPLLGKGAGRPGGGGGEEKAAGGAFNQHPLAQPTRY